MKREAKIKIAKLFCLKVYTSTLNSTIYDFVIQVMWNYVYKLVFLVLAVVENLSGKIVKHLSGRYASINPFALRTAKTLWSFGGSECNRVKSVKGWIGDNKRLCAMETCLRLQRSPPHGEGRA